MAARPGYLDRVERNQRPQVMRALLKINAASRDMFGKGNSCAEDSRAARLRLFGPQAGGARITRHPAPT
ncbi:hypothetical protein LZ190_09855 [Rhodovulum sulfidophilum]|nr:hypothetical protein [Rhodovulum sulfidophilum]